VVPPARIACVQKEIICGVCAGSMPTPALIHRRCSSTNEIKAMGVPQMLAALWTIDSISAWLGTCPLSAPSPRWS
jgi:hypothetical protein